MKPFISYLILHSWCLFLLDLCSSDWDLWLHLSFLGYFQSRGWQWQDCMCLVYLSVLPPFPGDANDCEQTPTQPSHILCTAQTSIPVAMTLLDLGAPNILVQSQDRQMQNWAFFILNSTRTLLILGRGFLQTELMGLPWHDNRYFLCPREPEHARGRWTGKLEPNCRCVNTYPCLSLQGLSKNLLVASSGDSRANHTLMCASWSTETKGLEWQSKKTKWELLMSRNDQSDWDWATLCGFVYAQSTNQGHILYPSFPGSPSLSEAHSCLPPPASYCLSVPLLTCSWLVATHGHQQSDICVLMGSAFTSWARVPVMIFKDEKTYWHIKPRVAGLRLTAPVPTVFLNMACTLLLLLLQCGLWQRSITRRTVMEEMCLNASTQHVGAMTLSNANLPP